MYVRTYIQCVRKEVPPQFKEDILHALQLADDNPLVSHSRPLILSQFFHAEIIKIQSGNCKYGGTCSRWEPFFAERSGRFHGTADC